VPTRFPTSLALQKVFFGSTLSTKDPKAAIKRLNWQSFAALPLGLPPLPAAHKKAHVAHTTRAFCISGSA